MKCALAVVVACIAITLVGATAPLLNMDSKAIVPNEYIVVFQQGVTQQMRDEHIEGLSATFATNEKIKHKYAIGEFVGYSAVFNKDTLAKQLESPIVRYVEANAIVTAYDTATTQTGATWGIDRISQRNLPLNQEYEYWTSGGENVNSYVVDTGIRVTHTEFAGRAVWGFNAVDSVDEDGNGHGTHVAGTIGGTIYGVAKKTTLIAVKVLAANGSGTTDGVIAGVNFVASDSKKRGKKAVANMSLGGGASTALDESVAAAISAGVPFALAAGNSNANACTTSPARVPTAVTVCATTNTDARASYSNFGTCVDICAPGSAITAAWSTSDTALNTISGTSMASPHVCGAIAVYIGHGGSSTPSDVDAFLAAQATPNVVKSPGTGTPNKLLYSPFQ